MACAALKGDFVHAWISAVFFSDCIVIRKARTIYHNSVLASILDTIEYYYLNPAML